MSHPEYRFEIALSFAGDNKRDLVRNVAELLQQKVGNGKVFFDEWFEPEIAGHDGEIVLQNIYRKKARLVVTCVCERYNEKPWTQDEWRAIRAFERDLRDAGSDNLKRMRFLPLRFGDGAIDDLFDNAIVPDVRYRKPEEIATLILDRLNLATQENTKDVLNPATQENTKDVDRYQVPGEIIERSGRFEARGERAWSRAYVKYHIQSAGQPISFSDVFNLWQSDIEFVDFFTSIFQRSGYSNFIWETPAISMASERRAFEFVLHNLPKYGGRPDRKTYAEYFDTTTAPDGIVSFKNLGGDALLIVPSPYRQNADYSGMAEFFREAPISQQRGLWREVGRHAKSRLSARPMWLSVASGGIYWLHIRIDSIPKYYRYTPYTGRD